MKSEMPSTFGQRGLQAANDVAGADIALRQRLQIDLDAAAVERGVGAVDADEGRQALDGGILQNHVGERLLAVRHGGKGNVLRAFGNAQDDAGILHREKAFGNIDVEQDGGDQGADGDQQGDGAILQHDLSACGRKRR